MDLVEEIFKTKCKKYNDEQLTEQLKQVLFTEAEKESYFGVYCCYINLNKRKEDTKI